jgi:DeoR family glycerol-3-phosphate regulon repressor
MNRRQADILELLQARGELTVSDLAGRFRVTPATIRRDFQYLEDEGRLVRGHGSAILSPSSIAQLAFVRKGQKREAEKRAIGRAIAAEIQPGMTVSLDTGTTTLEIARAIAAIPNIKVLTISLPIASVLHAQENLEVILMGGAVRQNDPDLQGALTEENLRRFRVDLAVL